MYNSFCEMVDELDLLSDIPIDYSSFFPNEDYSMWDDAGNMGVTKLKEVLDIIDHVDSSKELATVIGVLGQWGSGKTSILKGIKNYYDKHDKNETESKQTIAIYYEAWKHYNKENPLMPLVLKLRKSLNNLCKKNRKIRKEFNKLVKETARATLSNVTVNIPILSLSFDVNSFSNIFSRSKAFLSIDEQFRYLFNLITNTGIGGNKRKLVILIDDMDRLLPGEAVNLIKIIRFYFDAENVIVVIAIDDAVIKDFIKSEYENSQKIFIERNFLNKIIQYPVYLNISTFNDLLSVLPKSSKIPEVVSNSIKFYFERMPKMPYRIWKRIINRMVMKMKELCISYRNYLPPPDFINKTAFLAVLYECFPDIAEQLRVDPVLEWKIETEFEDYPHKKDFDILRNTLKRSNNNLFKFLDTSGVNNMCGRESAIWEIFFL